MLQEARGGFLCTNLFQSPDEIDQGIDPFVHFGMLHQVALDSGIFRKGSIPCSNLTWV